MGDYYNDELDASEDAYDGCIDTHMLLWERESSACAREDETSDEIEEREHFMDYNDDEDDDEDTRRWIDANDPAEVARREDAQASCW